jgi:hypothetical protein
METAAHAAAMAALKRQRFAALTQEVNLLSQMPNLSTVGLAGAGSAWAKGPIRHREELKLPRAAPYARVPSCVPRVVPPRCARMPTSAGAKPPSMLPQLNTPIFPCSSSMGYYSMGGLFPTLTPHADNADADGVASGLLSLSPPTSATQASTDSTTNADVAASLLGLSPLNSSSLSASLLGTPDLVGIAGLTQCPVPPTASSAHTAH